MVLLHSIIYLQKYTQMFVIWFAIFNTIFVSVRLIFLVKFPYFKIIFLTRTTQEKKNCRRTENIREMTWAANLTKLKELSKEKKQTHQFNNCINSLFSDAYTAYIFHYTHVRYFSTHYCSEIIHLTKFCYQVSQHCIGSHTINIMLGLLNSPSLIYSLYIFRYKRYCDKIWC